VPRKLILCRCEDVTAEDVAHAVAAGFDDVEEVKRYTGFGTGPCQGKECLRQVVLAIAAAAGRAPADLRPFTARPPIAPTELKYFGRAAQADGGAAAPARDGNEADPIEPVTTMTTTATPPEAARQRPDAAADAPSHATLPSAADAPSRAPLPSATDAPSRAPLPSAADVVIIGGGVMGLAIAYNLARLGLTRVAVLEASFIASGASGRNGGGLRQQWSTEMNIRLMQESIELCGAFAHDMRINIWMRQGGYLFLIRTDAARAEVERSIALQNRCAVPTRLISVDDARRIVPELEIDTDRFVAASYNPTDAVVFPWPFLWGYAGAAARLGVGVHAGTPVTAIERRGDGDFLVRTPRGTVRAPRVVNAAGAWSPRVAALLGLALPNWPVRHEILSTEPLKPFLEPMVSVLESGLYFSQSLRGELVGGITMPEPLKTDKTDDQKAGAADDQMAGAAHDRSGEIQLGSRLAFLDAMSAGLREVMPRLGDVKVVRQWAGPYDLTTDGNPIVGEAPGLPGFFLCCGFMGHGFMMAPVVAKYYALHLLGRETHPFFQKWRLDRFAEGGGETEDMIIG
jgi:sarcosine oxidase subunit beta